MSRQIRWYIALIGLSLASSNTGPIKTCVFFFVACVILRIIFIFRFSQYACLCKQVGFLLRRSHFQICDPILENHTSGHTGQFCFYSYNEVLSGYLPCGKIL